jgi:hexosaminidase
MWSEWVSPETIDSRIWPRTAAIAERFWSPREVKDVPDMYRRLMIVSVQLEELGLLHERNYSTMLRRLAGSHWGGDESTTRMLRSFVDLIEPVKGYKRGQMQNATQFTPLTRLADAARPDSRMGRLFAEQIDEFLYNDKTDNMIRTDPLRQFFTDWANASRYFRAALAANSPVLSEGAPLAEGLEDVCKIGTEALAYLRASRVQNAEWRDDKLSRLETAAQPKAAVEIVVVQPVRELVIAAVEQEKRKTMSAEEWKRHVKSLAAPKKPSK